VKKIFFILLVLGFPFILNACEIFITVEGTKKEIYKAGDIVVIKITVKLKHRNCNVDINETAIRVSGSQITATTKWTNVEARTWERKIKIKIANNKERQTVIAAERTCEKDGGKGSLTLTTSD